MTINRNNNKSDKLRKSFSSDKNKEFRKDSSNWKVLREQSMATGDELLRRASEDRKNGKD